MKHSLTHHALAALRALHLLEHRGWWVGISEDGMRRHPGLLSKGIECGAECADGTRCRALVWYREDRGRCHHHRGRCKPRETASEVIGRLYPMIPQAITDAWERHRETGDRRWVSGPLGWGTMSNQFRQLVRDYMKTKVAG